MVLKYTVPSGGCLPKSGWINKIFELSDYCGGEIGQLSYARLGAPCVMERGNVLSRFGYGNNREVHAFTGNYVPNQIVSL